MHHQQQQQQQQQQYVSYAPEMGGYSGTGCQHDPQGGYQLSSSAPEYTTCIDCLYQKRPS